LDQKIEREKNEAIEMKNLRKLMKQELAWIKKAPRGRQTKSVHREKRFYNIEEEYDNRKKILNKEKIEMGISMEERRLG
jgi:ATPase subunit of ABC transporter with duplicated ATPase domains